MKADTAVHALLTPLGLLTAYTTPFLSLSFGARSFFPFSSRARADMPSRSSSKFLSRPSVGDIVCAAYDLLTAAGQVINPMKSSSTTAQRYDNEAAVKAFQNAVSALLTMPYLVLIDTPMFLVQEEPRVVQ